MEALIWVAGVALVALGYCAATIENKIKNKRAQDQNELDEYEEFKKTFDRGWQAALQSRNDVAKAYRYHFHNIP